MSNPNPPANKNHPPRAVVERIAGEEAYETLVSLGAVLGMSRDGRAAAARRRAFRRILRETGCSVEGLAHVWGCHPNSITSALRKERPPRQVSPDLYDAQTRQRLAWRYGEARTAQIIAVKDPWTQRDLAAWDRLGHGGRTAA